jgi:hypothetical protein
MKPDRIKPVEPNYVVTALVDCIHSLFRGRKPRRRDARSKRARGFDPNGCCMRGHTPLALRVKEASKEGGYQAAR